MNENYYLYIDQQYGPFNLDVMGTLKAEGRLTKDTWVFFDGETAGWTRAEEVKSLSKLFQPVPVMPREDVEMGTMLVSPTKNSGVKKIESKLPQAPLSDLPAEGNTMIQMKQATPEAKPSLWSRLFGGLFGKKVKSR